MSATIDFSRGLWVDTDYDGTADAPAGSVEVNLGSDFYWISAGPKLHGDSPVSIESFGYFTTVIGTDGEDELSGGARSDNLFGGKGDDSLFSFHGNDVLNGQGGNDRLVGSETRFDNSTLNGGSGDDSIRAWGRDVVRGGAGDDIVAISDVSKASISGGKGNDEFDFYDSLKSGTLNGGTGNDTLIVDDDRNIFRFDISSVENLLVKSIVRATSHQLNAFHTIGSFYDRNSPSPLNTFTIEVTTKGVVDIADNILHKKPLHIYASKFGNTLVGGHGPDILTGGKGNDVLVVGSGKDFGKQEGDVLEGGKGNDHFVFNASLKSNRDVVVDFNHRDDTFDLENAVMTKLGRSGHDLNPDFFHTGSGRQDANDYILYNKFTGELFYDANANAAGGLHLLAVLQGSPHVTADDFHVI